MHQPHFWPTLQETPSGKKTYLWSTPPRQGMERAWLLALLLLQIVPMQEALGVGAGVGIGIGGGGGGGGGGVWIGGGISSPPNQNPPGSSSLPNLEVAYNALQAWKSSITEDPQGVLKSWVGPDVCSYRGIFCADSQENFLENNGPVLAGIDLNRANLQGTLAAELASLTDLTLLHLNSNRLSGSVPSSFTGLTSLQELDLSNNRLSGTFPSSLLSMPSLLYLDLRYNSFSGPIPPELFTNGKLDAILLNNNRFDGDLPETLGSSQASVINLANNRLSGSIPASLGFMSGNKIREILLLNNQLTGCIPEGIGLFSDMQVFDVSYNSLMGHLPDTVSCLTQIEVLNLGHNKLSGVLPDVVCSLKSLVNLTVAYNFFSGFSQECTTLPFRNVGFDFAANCIPNRQMQRPQLDCSAIPGGGLNCLRIPGASQPLICGAIGVLSRTVGDLAGTVGALIPAATP
ncbi:leucine-rich repeat extensin-like protein 6 [Syzygium oleosum]|uniref:leucine-rich repeat extensin-like protein 6 n=1 Tax=Syzygium oleosum TaxID=219896 RepID=UPI0024B97358|nr:leucine-rich repeat extensin-like protein 6 [Syzygium oleosum]